MRQKTKSQPEKKNGVTLTTWNGHPTYRWRVSFPDGNKRKSKGFKKKSGEGGAQQFADEKRKTISRDGNRHEEITDAERRAVLMFRDMVGSLPGSILKPTLADAVNLLRDTLSIRNKSKTVTDAVGEYLDKLERKKVSQSHLYTLKLRLQKFSAEYGDWLTCDVSSQVVADWLTSLSLAPLTTNHYRTALLQLFNHALEQKIVESNPVLAIPKQTEPPGEIEIFTPSQVSILLKNASHEIQVGLAIGFFAGVRPAELRRLDWAEINFDEGYIEIKAAKSKTASRRLIPIQENLRKWIFPQQQSLGSVMPSNRVWRSRLKVAMNAANISKWPNNVARHSFASYHLANFKDTAALALEMGHGSTQMIFKHYRAVVTPKAAEKFWAISPDE